MAPITFAHRGARIDEPENTLAAFRRALAAGATGLESDAWLTADGEVVLVHDPVVRRGLRRRKVRRSTAAELATLDVPRLADLYEACGTDFELSIDLKHPEVAGPLVEVARAAGPAAPGHLWLCSPDLAVVRDLVRDAPDVRTVHSTRPGRIETTLERHAAELAGAGVDVMNMHHTDWTGGLVSLFHRFGVLAFAWDAQEVRHLRAMLRIGIDGLYCDRPERLVATVGEWSDGPGRDAGADGAT